MITTTKKPEDSVTLNILLHTPSSGSSRQSGALNDQDRKAAETAETRIENVSVLFFRSTTGGASEMELADFATAIPDGQFDFIIFEACLMSEVEMAYELRNKTDYILVSSAELLVTGYGLLYPWASKYLFDTSLEVSQGLEKFAGCYFDHANGWSGVYRSATQSIVCMREMDALADLAAEVFGSTNPSLDKAALTALQHFDRPGSYGDTPTKLWHFYKRKKCTPHRWVVNQGPL